MVEMEERLEEGEEIVKRRNKLNYRKLLTFGTWQM